MARQRQLENANAPRESAVRILAIRAYVLKALAVCYRKRAQRQQ